jgi:hypothetical protein
MKVRNGFVSNSSSSSFLIWGVQITQDKIAYPEDMSAFDFVDANADLVQCAGPNDDYFF